MIGARFYTVRRSAGRYAQGLWEHVGQPSEWKILAALQTASPLAVSLLEDGRRAAGASILLVPLGQPELEIGEAGRDFLADQIFDGARWYTVTSRANNSRAGGAPHRSYNLAEIQPETAKVLP